MGPTEQRMIPFHVANGSGLKSDRGRAKKLGISGRQYKKLLKHNRHLAKARGVPKDLADRITNEIK